MCCRAFAATLKSVGDNASANIRKIVYCDTLVLDVSYNGTQLGWEIDHRSDTSM